MKSVYGREIPKCIKGNHKWKKGAVITGEAGICAKCGYDIFDETYKKYLFNEVEK